MVVNDVLVTGGCGFVGERIVRHLHEQYPDCHITVIDRVIPAKFKAEAKKNAAIEYFKIDITSLDELQAFFHQRTRPFQAVCHVAGISPPLSERYSRRLDALVFKINVQGTTNVVQLAQQTGVKAFVYTSSVCAVTDDFSQPYANIDERWPVVQRGKATSYGESKAAAERVVLAANNTTAGFKTCALRPSVIFGEGDYQLVPNMVNCIVHKNESPYKLGDGCNLWDATYVGNVADAHVLAIAKLLDESAAAGGGGGGGGGSLSTTTTTTATAAGEAIFISNEAPVSCRDFMLQIWKEYNGHIPPFEVQIPLGLAWVVGVVCEVYSWVTGSPVTLSRGSIHDAVAMRYVNGQKARDCLGYVPRVDMEEGLRRTCKWIRENNVTARLNVS